MSGWTSCTGHRLSVVHGPVGWMWVHDGDLLADPPFCGASGGPFPAWQEAAREAIVHTCSPQDGES